MLPTKRRGQQKLKGEYGGFATNNKGKEPSGEGRPRVRNALGSRIFREGPDRSLSPTIPTKPGLTRIGKKNAVFSTRRNFLGGDLHAKKKCLRNNLPITKALRKTGGGGGKQRSAVGSALTGQTH